jgi:dienelactone hydrolase
MRTWRTTIGVGVLLAVLATLGHWAPSARAAQGGIASEELTLQLGDFTSRAVLDYPADRAGPFPTLVMYHGGCACDRDEAFGDQNGIQSTNYKTIAQALVPQGFAVLRYNKRYVEGPGQFDGAKLAQVKLADTLADARVALAAARANPRVDPRRVFVYGWSEGAKIASAVAATELGLAGLIVQGPDVGSDREVTLAQLREVNLPFAASFVRDGRLTAASLTQALSAPNGWFAADFIDQTKTDGVAVNPFFDANKDGVLDIASEVTPRLEAYVDARLAPGGNLADYASLPSIAERAAALTLPVLVLHGANDGLALARLVRGLDNQFAGRADYTRKEYPGLGHSLGSASSVIDTGGQFAPIAAEPLADLAAWLGAQAARPAALPKTGGETVPLVALVLLGGLVSAAGLALRQVRTP